MSGSREVHARRAELQRQAQWFRQSPRQAHKARRPLEQLLKIELSLGRRGDPAAVHLKLAEVVPEDRSLHHLRRALSYSRSDLARATALEALGEALYDRDQDREAEKVLRKAVEIRGRIGPPSAKIAAIGLHAFALYACGRRREAADRFREAVILSRGERDWSAEVGWVRHWLETLGQDEELAWRSARSAYGVFPLGEEKKPSGAVDGPQTADLHHLAAHYRSLRELELAQGALRRALELARPDRTLQWAALINHQAALDFDANRIESAIIGHREAVRLAELVPHSAAASTFRVDLAFVLDHVDDPGAEQALGDAMQSAEQTRDGLSAAWALRELGRRAVRRNELPAAMDHLKRAVQFSETSASAEALARSAYGAALVAGTLGDPDTPTLVRRAGRAAAAQRHGDLRANIERDLGLLEGTEEGNLGPTTSGAVFGALRQWAGVTEQPANAARWVDSLHSVEIPASMVADGADALARVESCMVAGEPHEAVRQANAALGDPSIAGDRGASFWLRQRLADALAFIGTAPSRVMELANTLRKTAQGPSEHLVAAVTYADASAELGQARRGVAALDEVLADPEVRRCAMEENRYVPSLVERARLNIMLHQWKRAEEDLGAAEVATDSNARSEIPHLRARIAEMQGNRPRAVAYGREALEAARLEGGHHQVALCAVDYARVLEEDDPDTARELLTGAVETLERVGDLKCLARARGHLRDVAEDSEAWREEQLELRRRAGNANDLSIELVQTALDAGGNRQIELLDEALELLGTTDAPEGRFIALGHLVTALLSQDEDGDSDKPYLRRAVVTSRQLVDELELARAALPTAEGRQQLLEAYGAAYGLHALCLLLDNQPKESFAVAELGRARVLTDAMWEEANRAGEDRRALRTALVEALRELRTVRSSRGDVASAERRVEQLEHLIADATGTSTLDRTFTADDVMATLDSTTAVVSFVFAGGAVIVYCLTDEELSAFPLSVSEETAQRRASEMITALSQRMRRYPHGYALWRYLLEPVIAEIGGRSAVIIADGALQSLPWGALFTSPPDAAEAVLEERWKATNEEGAIIAPEAEVFRLYLSGDLRHEPPRPVEPESMLDLMEGLPPLPRSDKLPYALRRYRLLTCPSVAALLTLRSRPRLSAPRSAVIVADPRLQDGAVPTRQAIDLGLTSGLAPLPHTAKEARNVARRYDRGVPRLLPERWDGAWVAARLGAHATRDEVLRLLDGAASPDIVHVASHGLADVEDPLLSCIVLSGEDDGGSRLLTPTPKLG